MHHLHAGIKPLSRLLRDGYLRILRVKVLLDMLILEGNAILRGHDIIILDIL